MLIRELNRHFTQVTWAGTTKVGCGQTSGGGGTCTVCQYDPPGNYNNQYAANVQDCDTSVAWKCPTTQVRKVDAPLACLTGVDRRVFLSPIGATV